MRKLTFIFLALCLMACDSPTEPRTGAGRPGGRGAGSASYIQNATCGQLEDAIVNPARYVGRYGNYETEVFIRASATYVHQCESGGEDAAK